MKRVNSKVAQRSRQHKPAHRDDEERRWLDAWREVKKLYSKEDAEKILSFFKLFVGNPLFAAKCNIIMHRGVNPALLFLKSGERAVWTFPVMKNKRSMK